MEPPRTQREHILREEIFRLQGEGYREHSCTDTSARLTRPRPRGNFVLNVLLTLISGGLWLLVWMPISIVRWWTRTLYGDWEMLEVEVLEDGTLQRS